MIESVLFDLDGTLLNTTDGVLESAIYAAKTLGYHELPREIMRSFVGPPIQQSFMKWYGCTIEEAQHAANLFRNYYKDNALFKAELYPGVIEMLENLKNIRMKIGVATYKREDYAISILEHFGISQFCDTMHGADNMNVLTKADIINTCISDMSSKNDNVVLVGDTEHDAKGTIESAIKFIGVTYGFGFVSEKDVNYYPNIGCAGNTNDIINIIKSYRYEN